MSWIADQWRRHEWLLYIVTGLAAVVTTILALQLWKADFNAPFTYYGDAIAVGDHFKTVMQTGWFTYQSHLGAPYGQTYSDFPTAENLNFMAAGVFGLLTHNWVLSMNLYYLFGFVASALTSLWLFRRLRISRLISVVLALLFAIAPYHFVRGESHLFLGSYYIVPLSIGIVIMAIRGEALWTRNAPGTRWYRWFGSRAAGTLLILVLTATAETYYAVFFLILLAFAGVVRLISTGLNRNGEWRRFWGAAIAGAVTAFALLLNTLPATIYGWINGQDPAALVRGRADSEIYALKLTQLLLPWPGNRVPLLASIRGRYDALYPLISENPALGAVGAAGLLALIGVTVYVIASFGRNRLHTSEFAERFRLLTQLAALAIVAFLFSTIGGFSTIISFLTTSLRGWNRISIYIALISLAAVGILLDAAIAWLRTKTVRFGARGSSIAGRAIAIIVAAVVLVGGFIDQTPSGGSLDYPGLAKAYNSDDAYFARVDKVLPVGAEVLQLPYQPFPESVSSTGIQSSDVLRPFLHTPDLKWSGGGIKGRPRADWPGMLEQYSPADIVTLAAASGFSGILVDRLALEKDQYRPLLAGLTATLGVSPLSGSNNRYAFYDIRTERKELRTEFGRGELARVEKSIIDPVIADTSTTFQTTTDEDGKTVERSTAAVSPITLTSTKSVRARLETTVTLVQKKPEERELQVTLPGGKVTTVTLVNGKGVISLPISVPVGVSTLALTLVDAAPTEAVELDLGPLVIQDRTVTKFLAKQ